MKHDKWSALGMKNMGDHNIKWGETAGWDMLIKAILNDYWADVPPTYQNTHWDYDKIDMVMSKLYYCWVRRVFSPTVELELEEEE
jgi:hypothetical protein